MYIHNQTMSREVLIFAMKALSYDRSLNVQPHNLKIFNIVFVPSLYRATRFNAMAPKLQSEVGGEGGEGNILKSADYRPTTLGTYIGGSLASLRLMPVVNLKTTSAPEIPSTYFINGRY